jgi:hypothetical protein
MRALLKRSSRKPALMDSNQLAIDLGFDYAKAHSIARRRSGSSASTRPRT